MSIFSLHNPLSIFRRIIMTTFGLATTSAHLNAGEREFKSIYDFTVTDIAGQSVPLSKYKGKVMLIVNVASRCGFTPQYASLQSLFEKYKDQGLAILGFPANNFLRQEPGSNEEIKTFCQVNYGVTFDMFSKISVKGSDQAPLYKFLTSKETNPNFAGDVKWNFQKYLIDREGNILGSFSPRTDPLSREIVAAIEAALR